MVEHVGLSPSQGSNWPRLPYNTVPVRFRISLGSLSNPWVGTRCNTQPKIYGYHHVLSIPFSYTLSLFLFLYFFILIKPIVLWQLTMFLFHVQIYNTTPCPSPTFHLRLHPLRKICEKLLQFFFKEHSQLKWFSMKKMPKSNHC
jgi:hypothetical protein